MKRRDLFATLGGVLRRDTAAGVQQPTGSLDPWQPTANNPWDRSAVLHFYSRLGFSPTYAEVQSALTRSPKDLLREAMEDEWCSTRMPGPLPGWEQWLYVQHYNGSDLSKWQ